MIQFNCSYVSVTMTLSLGVGLLSIIEVFKFEHRKLSDFTCSNWCEIDYPLRVKTREMRDRMSSNKLSKCGKCIIKAMDYWKYRSLYLAPCFTLAIVMKNEALRNRISCNERLECGKCINVSNEILEINVTFFFSDWNFKKTHMESRISSFNVLVI